MKEMWSKHCKRIENERCANDEIADLYWNLIELVYKKQIPNVQNVSNLLDNIFEYFFFKCGIKIIFKSNIFFQTFIHRQTKIMELNKKEHYV